MRIKHKSRLGIKCIAWEQQSTDWWHNMKPQPENAFTHHRCFLFALHASDNEAILDAYLVVAREAEQAETALRHHRGIITLGRTRCLGEWNSRQVEARCWIEATRQPISLMQVSVHSLAEIMWD